MFKIILLAILLTLWFFGLITGVVGAITHSLLVIALMVVIFIKIKEHQKIKEHRATI